MFAIPRFARLFFLASLVSPPIVAAEPHSTGETHHHPAMHSAKSARTALAVGVTLDQKGRLWLARVVDQRLLVSWSEDGGSSFSEPAVVTPEPENISIDGENRPKIEVGRDGSVLVTWTQVLPQKYSGNVRFSRSIDSGRTFSVPITLNDDGRVTSHRFDSLAIDGDGRVMVAWLDARDRDAAREKGEEYRGVSLYTAQSFDNGESFGRNRRIQEHTCECCRTALTWSRDGPIVLLRNIFGANTRDFAVVNLDKGGVRRVNRDEWQVDACPHNGGSLATDRRGQLHLVWFTNGTAGQGLFYKRIDGNWESKPRPIGNADAQANHASVVAHGETIILTWREFDGNAYSAKMMYSNDSGESWSEPMRLMESAGASDYPVPLIDNRKVLIVWNTAKEGLRILPIERVTARYSG
jgi:hypothetical protein